MSVYIHVRKSKIGPAWVGPFVNSATAILAAHELEDLGCKTEIITPIPFGRWLNLLSLEQRAKP